MPRLFVALPLAPDVAREVSALQRGLPDVRWTSEDDLHLTLRSVGEVDHPTFCEIGEALTNVSMAPFDLRLAGLGQFPPRGPLRQLWVGVEKNEALERLKRRVDRSLSGLDLPNDRRRFVPHVTIARFRGTPATARFGSWIAARSLFRGSAFPVSDFCLFSSRLRPEGAEHLIEARYDFVTGAMERV